MLVSKTFWIFLSLELCQKCTFLGGGWWWKNDLLWIMTCELTEPSTNHHRPPPPLALLSPSPDTNVEKRVLHRNHKL